MHKASDQRREGAQEYIPQQKTVNMKRRSLSATWVFGVFLFAFACIVIAFATPSWLVSKTGAKWERLGLWLHCFRSVPDANDDSQRRFFVDCRRVYDPFPTGFSEIKECLRPAFMKLTQFFYTLAFMGMLLSAVVFFLCAGRDQKHFVLRLVGYLQLATGIFAAIAVIRFAACGWMPEHSNNWFGWSFVTACVGAVFSLVAAVLFLNEANVQRKQLKESLPLSATTNP